MSKGMQHSSSLSASDYWLRLRPRRWLIAACVVAGWAVGTGAGWLLPARYRSETVVLIEQQKVAERYVQSNMTADLQDRLQSISQEILSRTRLLTLITKLHLYAGDVDRVPPDALVERMRKDIKVLPIRSDSGREGVSSFKVAYSAPTAALAKQVTGELTSLFIDENQKDRTQFSEDTTTFLTSQLAEARKSLDEQEERLRQFKSQHLGELPEQLQGNLQILAGLQTQLQAATDALNQAEQHRLYLRSLVAQYQGSPVSGARAGGAVDRTSPMTLDQQLETLKAQLADLSGRYTPLYPDILRLKGQIAQLEAQRAKVREAGRNSHDADDQADTATAPLSGTRDASPLIQVTGELSANELEIANHKARITRLEGEVNRYQGRLNATPVREQQSASVSRDYDQSRAYYESLLSKKLQSEMATNLEKWREGLQFRVIDPPNLPELPYWPNRLAFSVGGLGLGLIVGLGFVLFKEMMNPCIYREEELGEFSGTGFILGIPTLATEHEQRKHSRFRVLEGLVAGTLTIAISVLTVLVFHKR